MLPNQINQTKQDLYREVISDLMEKGLIDRESSLEELKELRQSLDLQEADHHQAVSEIAANPVGDSQGTVSHAPTSASLRDLSAWLPGKRS